MAQAEGYGTHPTIYASYTNEELFAAYRASSWFGLDEHHRQQLLQETANRAAAVRGELGACEVRFADLQSGTLGQQSGNLIELNRSVFAQDSYTHTYNGRTISEFAQDSNFRALETVLHEDIHAWQNQCVEGVISTGNPALVEQYASNNFTLSYVPDENGGTRLGSHYLNGVTEKSGYYLYYFQSTERDAHQYAEKETVRILHGLESRYGEDSSMTAYLKHLEVNGFDVTSREAQQLFGVKDFEQEVNKVLYNQYYGANLPVDPSVEQAVQKEMAASYALQYNLDMKLGSGQSAGADNPPGAVSIEAYNSSVGGGETALYTHGESAAPSENSAPAAAPGAAAGGGLEDDGGLE